MSDLIDRQAAIDALKAHEDYKGYLHGDFEEILESLPSAQSEIIRCKDCKYYRPMTDQDDICAYRQMQVFPDDYCSRAERRTDDANDIT